MNRVYTRKSTNATGYTKEALKQALVEIQRGVITQYITSSRTMGRSTAIPPEEEAKITESIISMEKWSWGLTRH